MQKTHHTPSNALSHYLQRVRHQTFAWGQHDCALFAAQCCRLQTGLDPACDYRGHYRTALGARRALTRYGDGTLAGAFDKHFTRTTPNYAMRGDVVLIKQQQQHIAGMVWSGGVVTTGERGLVTLKISDIQLIWEVSQWRVPSLPA